MIRKSIPLLSLFLQVILVVSINAIHHDGNNQEATFHPTVTTIHPNRGSELGRTELILKGSGFSSENFTSSCCFDKITFDTEIISDNEIRCWTPPNRPGKVFISLCNRDKIEEEDSASHPNESNNRYLFEYEYTIMATVFSLLPSSGSGGNEVEITGSGFVNSSDLCCRFNSTVIPATYISNDRIKCISPSFDVVPSSVLVTVSNNGADIEGDWAAVMFNYTLPVTITSIDPTTAPSSGGTSLFVRGENFPTDNPEGILCKIGDVVMNATALSSDELVCNIPKISVESPTELPVSISINGGYEFNLGTKPSILVHSPTRLFSVVPDSVPETGNSIVSVYGEEFHHSPHLVCQFDDVAVPATWISNSILNCATPSSKIGTVNLRISTNGQNSGISESVPFTFSDEVTLTSISPSSGPLTGGTAIKLFGTGFVSSPKFLCRFGNTTTRDVVVFNSTTAQCVVPTSSSILENYAQVDVSINNGYDFTASRLFFRYKSSYQIDSISPRLGPSSGHTIVRMYGNFSSLDGNRSLCQFDCGDFKVTSPTMNVTNEIITCLSPSIRHLSNASTPIISLVELVDANDVNRLPLTATGALFTYYPPTILRDLHPALGSELGGTNVTVTGHFTRSSEIICKFDGQISPFTQWISKDTVLCTSPPVMHNFLVSPFVSVTILTNGEDDEGLWLPFQYLIASHISAITPTFGSVSGGTLVHLEGSGFPLSQNTSSFCSFGRILTEAEILSESLVRCQSPIARFTGTVPLTVTFNSGHEYISSSAEYTFISQPVIKKITPTYVPSSQRAQVQIIGENFSRMSNGVAWLSFGTFTLKARVINENLITFVSPFARERIISRIKVSLNGVDFTPVGPIFSVLPPPSITNVSPKFSNEYGGTPIVIEGSGFYNVSRLSCLFNFRTTKHPVLAKYKSFSSIECEAPPMITNTFTEDVDLELSLTGLSLNDNPSVKISYFTGVSVSSTYPSNCPKSGGSELSVIGHGFTQQQKSYYCKILEPNFSPLFVPAKFHSERMLNCTTPPSQNQMKIGPSTVDLTIVAKEGDQYYSTGEPSTDFVSFQYLDDIVLSEVIPDTGSVSGGSIVEVKGHNFVNSTSICCSYSFEGQKLSRAATFLSNSLVSCPVPKLPDSVSRTVTVSLLQLSNNGIDFSRDGLRFHHRQNIAVEATVPSLLPEYVKANITVYGRHFYHDGDLSCVFSSELKEVISGASYLSPTLVRCVSPALTPGLYLVSIKSSNIFSTSNVNVRVYPKLSLHKIEPMSGPFTGGTEVQLWVLNFPNSTLALCKFGEIPSKAIFISSERLMCIAPRQYFNESRSVKVSISGNGQDFTSDHGVWYTYNNDFSMIPSPPMENTSSITTSIGNSNSQLQLFQIAPSLGSTDGGQRVTIIGAGFLTHPSSVCRFGIQTVRAITLSSDTLECETPMAKNPGYVGVDVSIDGVDWTDKGLTYNFVQPFEIFDLRPRKFPMYGGTVIHITTSDIHSVDGMSCMFGLAGSVPAVVLSSNLLTCVSPTSSTAGIFSFDILVGDTTILSNGPLKLEFVKLVSFSIFPKFGSKEGNTTLEIHFDEPSVLEHDDLICTFEFENGEAYHTRLEHRNSTLQSCLTPKISNVTSSKEFILANVNLKSMSSTISMTKNILPSFIFKSTPKIVRTTPQTGDIGGGTKVTLISDPSSGLWINSNLLRCMFGRAVVKGVWISKHKVECDTPSQRIRDGFRVPISVAENGVDFVQVGYFHYLNTPSVIDLQKHHAFSSVVSDIQINISGLTVIDNPTCMFRTGSTKRLGHASAVNNTLLKCSLPAYEVGEEVYVYVSNNMQEFSSTFSVIKIISIPRLSSIKPQSGLNGSKTIVSLLGENLITSMSWECQIGDNKGVQQNQVYSISESAIQCEITCPESPSIQSYHVSLRTNEAIETSSVLFWCYPKPKLLSLSPSMIFAGYQQILTIDGVGFVPTQRFKCIFYTFDGHILSDANFIDASTLACLIPHIEVPQIVDIDLSTDGSNFLGQKLQAEIISPYVIHDIKPQRLVVGGQIKIEGDFRSKVIGLMCRIGGMIGRFVEFENHSSVICHTSFGLTPDKYTMVELLLGDTVISSHETSISVYGLPVIQNVSPSKALRFYSTTVIVKGENFMSDSNPICHFGQFESRADRTTANMISCRSPPSLEASVVPFRLTFGSIVAKNSHIFQYLDPWVLNKIVPSSGPLNGGTRVEIMGENFDPSINVHCLFGGAELVEAEIISSSTVQCISPSFESPQLVTISIVLASSGTIISIPSRDDYGVEPLNGFYFYEDGTPLDLSPKQGALSGGTEVIVHGTWFLHGHYTHFLSPKCAFGQLEVAARFLESGLISCYSPPIFSEKALNLTLRTSLNGFDFIDGNLSYFYHEEVFLQSITPNNGPTSGGTRVALNGIKNMLEAQRIQCRFGLYPPMYAYFDSSVNELICHTPAVKESSQLVLFLKIGTTGTWKNTERIFIFEDMITVKGVSPTKLNEDGGEIIRVTGEGFQAHVPVYCRFGNHYTVKAHHFSASLITCPSPSISDIDDSSELISISITTNKENYVDAPHLVQFASGIVVTHMHPNIGPSTGGTLITIYGAGFKPSDKLLCWFGEYATIANFISESSVSCRSSSFYLHGRSQLINVPVTISRNNSLRFGHNNVNMTFYYYKNWLASDIELFPTYGPRDFGINVGIRGEVVNTLLDSLGDNIVNENVLAYYGDNVIEATITLDGLEFRTVPNSSTSESVPIAISINGGIDTLPSPSIKIYDNPELIKVHPQVVINGYHSSIKVYGLNFPLNHKVTCRLGTTLTLANLVTDTMVSCPLPSKLYLDYREKTIRLSLSFNEQDFLSNDFPIFIQSTPSISEVIPQFISGTGGTIVVVKGSKLKSLENAGCSICLFYEVKSYEDCTSMHSIDDSQFQFTAPSGYGSNIQIQFRCGDEKFNATDLKLSYLPSLQLHSLLETRGNLEGGYKVGLKGKNFFSGSLYSCIMKGMEPANNEVDLKPIIVQANYTNETTISCHIPSAIDIFGEIKEGTFAIQVKRHIDFSISNERLFRYSESPLESPLKDAQIPEVINAIESHYNACEFDSLEPKAISTEKFSSIRNSTLNGGEGYRSLTTEMTNNFNLSEALTYGPLVIFESADTLTGSFRGGTIIHIHGKGFNKAEGAIDCMFGIKTTEARIINDTTLSCKSPPVYELFESLYMNSQESLIVSFGLSLRQNNVDYHFESELPGSLSKTYPLSSLTNDGILMTNPDLNFSYFQDEEIFTVMPKMCPNSGNVIVRIKGSGFIDLPQLSCKVGFAEPRRALFISENTVDCSIPSVAEALGPSFDRINNQKDDQIKSFVSVSNNGKDFDLDRNSNTASFSYFQVPTFVDFTPRRAVSGVDVYLHAIFLPAIEDPSCRFGNTVVNARLLSPSTLICTTPEFYLRSLPLKVDLDVTLNGFHFITTGFQFEYIETPIARRIEPPAGPDIGGNLVRVYGSNFDRVNQSIFCNFGDSLTNATVLSDTDLECHAPQSRAGRVQFSLRGSSFKSIIHEPRDNSNENTILSYKYLEDFHIKEIKPSFGTRLGNTAVSVKGSNFQALEDLICIFGENIITEAIFISQEQVRCHSPAHQIRQDRNVTLRIGISSGAGVTFLSGPHAPIFTYVAVAYIKKVYPSRGLLSGGDQVKVIGENFARPLYNKVMCAFGGIESIGEWLSSTEIQCLTPSMPSTGSMREIQRISISRALGVSEIIESPSFILTFDGESTSPIFWNATERDLKMELVSLPTIGDVSVTCASNFAHELMRNTYTYDVTFTTSGSPPNTGSIPLIEVDLLSPIHGATIEVQKVQDSCCNVEISLNYVDYFGGAEDSIVAFTFDEDIVISTVWPTHGSVGGGTQITLMGEGFIHINATVMSLFCIFGTEYVQASAINSKEIKCVTPFFPSPAKVKVSIELYSDVEGLGTRVQSTAEFEFVSDPEIFDTFPTFFPVPRLFQWDVVHVYGKNFIDSKDLGCRFQHIDSGNRDFVGPSTLQSEFDTRATFHNSSYIQCLNYIEAGNIMHWKNGAILYITTNGIDTSEGHTFEIIKAHTVSSVFPESGPWIGGTEVLVQGSNFVNTENLSCRFGNRPTVRALYRSPSAIICVVPPSRSNFTDMNNTVHVDVTNNGYHFTSSEVLFHFHDTIQILSLEPQVGPSHGGTHLSIKLGDEIMKDRFWDYVCKFNATHVPATKVGTRSLISCTSPPSFSHGGHVSFEVALNGFDFSSSGMQFLYLPGQKSESMFLSPSHGPINGGTLVRIDGLSRIISKHQWKSSQRVPSCKFGDVVVPAVDVDHQGKFMSCRSPDASLNGNATKVLVDVSLTGAFEDFTAFGAIFQYDDLVSIAEIKPQSGPTTGGTPIQIRGGPFPRTLPSELLCRFGNLVSNATWISSHEIGCVSPSLVSAHENERCHLAVSVNGVDFSLSFKNFHYQLEIEVIELFPSHGYPRSRILVEGNNFFQDQQFLCHFGSSDISTKSSKFHSRGIPATKHYNETHLECIVPPFTTTGYVPFFVSIDGSEIGGDQSSILFHYDEPLSILAAFPSTGPKFGKFSVLINGGPFTSPNYDYRCKFGSKIVPAFFISSNQITCHAPLHEPGVYQLRITQNGQDFSEDFKKILFYDQTIVDHIMPISGPARSAGSRVKFFGSNFINSTSAMCKFHHSHVPAKFISEHEIECITPALFASKDLDWDKLTNHRNGLELALFPEAHNYPLFASKLVEVEVTMNSQDFTNLGHKFLYQEDITIDHLTADVGPSWGGTPVFVHGSGFVNSTLLTCRFGHHLDHGIFLTRNLILCFSPPQSHVYVQSSLHQFSMHIEQMYLVGPKNNNVRNIYVEVSNNAVDFTDYRHVFEYSSMIPEGFYQAGVENTTILSCPRGSFCHGTFNKNFTMCPKGTFQSLPGQNKCSRCPIGFMCPEQGLPVPRICPSGYVCDVTGIENAEQPCPAGFHCPAGTVTSVTYCGKDEASSDLSARYTLAELSSTLQKGHVPLGNDLVIGGRRSFCWDNSTEDFGLQASIFPGQFWDEIHALPLDTDTPSVPLRGRYCQDDSCLSIQSSFETSIMSSFAFDHSKVQPQRPLPCPSGTYCQPGTSMNSTSSNSFSTPQACDGRNYCPEGSTSPLGMGDCPVGYFCRFGKKNVCPVGTFCPFSNTWDPLPCEPGSFNYMVGQQNCTLCPLGHFCNGYGRLDPGLCPPGYVCSKIGLASPNMRCPAGFYCPNGTQTSDPFRNDTTLRPYPCSPGTYCLSGVGYNDVVEGNFSYAQPCPAGFFCESASTSAKGSGLCPPGFICPKGTATPQPTPKGHYAELPGTTQAAACLPGFYAPTIESSECQPCPPGTSCEVEAMVVADICPPGSFRSTLERDGITCQTCPQGTWSKNWHLRDEGECTVCPTGLYCPIDGMTMPCSKTDLPMPFEPVLNLNGVPVLEFKFPSENAPPPFSIDECLQLNFASNKQFGVLGDHQFFFGELIPPYIDILGRGAHIRITDKVSTKYSHDAKCYRNLRPKGSVVYERMATYYGPQYDIQTGYPHQGYGSAKQMNAMFSVAPLQESFSGGAQYFYGTGTMYIDLPRSSLFDPSLNCTSGFHLMNSTLKLKNEEVVFTSSHHDYEGGIDVEKCSVFEPSLECFIDPTFQLHQEGECCNIKPWSQRAIYLAEDQFYPGTCEADLICLEEDPTEAMPCQDGFVCDEKTTSDSSISIKCLPGYVCSFGTTPDTSLDAPQGQFTTLCPAGYFCPGGTGLEATDSQCPEGYFCPTGTSDPFHGELAGDSINRGLEINNIDPSKKSRNIFYFGGDQFQLVSDHDYMCFGGIETGLKSRFSLTNIPFFRENDTGDAEEKEPESMSNAIRYQSRCARDGKWQLVKEATKRGDCDCSSQQLVVAAVYRLWQCTSNRIKEVCSWPDSKLINLTAGKIPYDEEHVYDESNERYVQPPLRTGLSFESGGLLELYNHGSLSEPNFQFRVQLNQSCIESFRTFSHLKEELISKYPLDVTYQDPLMFNLHRAILLIQKYGEKLEELVFFRQKAFGDEDAASIYIKYYHSPGTTLELVPGRLDICECQNLLTCPHGTTTLDQGSSKAEDCVWDGYDILKRISMIPRHDHNLTHVKNSSDYVELSGSSRNPINTLELNPYEVAVFDVDLSELPTNMTYADHYQISIYENCKPCPPRYRCDLHSSCSFPSTEEQFNSLNTCLKQHRLDVCVHINGTSIDSKWCKEQIDMYTEGYYSADHPNVKTDRGGNVIKTQIPEDEWQTFKSNYLYYTEPDLNKCMSIPLLCGDKEWNHRTFRRLCQDILDDGTAGPIYDCDVVETWKEYNIWKNNICCSNSPEFDGLAACLNNTCLQDPAVDKIIQEKFSKDFLMEHGFDPPLFNPKGTFLMDVGKQEDRLNPDPFSLFNEWDTYMEEDGTKIMKRHNIYRKNRGSPRRRTEGCCRCNSHPLPPFFEVNSKVSGYPDDKHDKLQLTISALERVELTVVIELLHGHYYKDFSSFFDNDDKFSLHVHRPGRFTSSSDSSMWLAVLDKEVFDRIPLDLPLNLPMRISGTTKLFENTILIDQPCEKYSKEEPLLLSINETAFALDDDGRRKKHGHCLPESSLLLHENSMWWSSGDSTITAHGNTEFAFIGLPYLPFFSSCSGYDSHMSLSRLVEEHPDCVLVAPESTRPVKQGPFSKDHTPLSDMCMIEQFDELGRKTETGISLDCQYEEQISIASDKLRWFEVEANEILFYITRDAISTDFFEVQSTEIINNLESVKQRWGRSKEILLQPKIPVTIDNIHGGKQNTIPRTVLLELQYYQIDKYTKRLVGAKLYFFDLCTTLKPEYFGGDPEMLRKMEEQNIYPCATDFNGNLKSYNYDMQVLFYPLDWFHLLNRFQFDGPVYLGFYTLAGTIMVTVGALVWSINYMSTKLRHPPKFHGASLARLIGVPSVLGCGLAAVLIIMTSLVVNYFWFVLSSNGLQNIQGDWYSSALMDYSTIQTNQKGRSGLALTLVGSYILFSGALLIIPTKVDKGQSDMDADDFITDIANESDNHENEYWKPRLWKRAHFIWYAICLLSVLLVFWEFSYSPAFEANLHRLIFGLKAAQVITEVALSQILREKLLCAPFMVLIGLSEILVTMGASDFVDFAIIYFIQISLAVAHKIYLDPYIKILQSLYPRWKFMFLQKLGSRKRKSVKEKQEEENTRKKINEEIELRNEGVEPLIDVLTLSSIQSIGRYLSPFAFLLISLYSGSSEMAEKYGIGNNELGYYGLFALYMIPWSLAVDVLVLNSQELVHGWRLYDYLEYQRHRFCSRERRWTLDSPNFDESITETMQSIDSMSFSSQYYFLVTFLSSGMFMIMLGMTILLRSSDYNALGDPSMPLLVVGVLVLCKILQFFVVWLGSIKIDYLDWRGVWGATQLEGTLDDVVAAKLAIGEGREVDLERERMELEALNDEKFRQRFLDRNRPWILQHIFDLFTTGDRDISDREMLLKHAKDLYTRLADFRDGARKPGDRADISSDDENQREIDDLYSGKNLSLDGPSLDIIKLWLQLARKRQKFRIAITDQIKNNVSSICSSCSRDKTMCISMKSYLARDGQKDASALDDLIAKFEAGHSSQSSDLTLWRSYFRQNAEVITLCNYCLNREDNNDSNDNTSSKKLPTRPGDISSDDEEDNNALIFPPILVDKDSVHGHLVSKWLRKARLKMGGPFPRPDAKKFAEKYIAQMKEQKSIKKSFDVPGQNGKDNSTENSVVRLDKSTLALMKKWLTAARGNLSNRGVIDDENA